MSLNDNDSVILSAVRTPIGKFGGSLANFSAADLGVLITEAAIERSGINADLINEVIFGHGRQAGGGTNTARQVGCRAGIPIASPAMTINKACASSLKAITLALQSIHMGDADIVLAGGTESMSNTPYMVTNGRWGHKLGHIEFSDGMYKDGFMCPVTNQLMGYTAETVAEQYDISRADQDQFAVTSQHRAAAATTAGRFDDEKITIEIKSRKSTEQFNTDEHIRGTVSLEKMAKLPAVFKENGTVHAGNASGITDGAAALVVCRAKTAKDLAATPLVKIAGYAAVGVDPAIMGIGPIPAVNALLKKTGLTIGDIDLIELNEAFAAQAIACQRELNLDMEKVNVNGGAIALGHPIGCTGARISVTLIHEMKRRNVQYGIATLCVSGGMGMAVLYENIN